MALCERAEPSQVTDSKCRGSEWRLGWVGLAGALGANATGSTLFGYLSGFFIQPLQAETGWSRAEIAVGTTIMTSILAVTTPLVGLLIDRFGSRSVGTISLLGYSLLCMAISVIPLQLHIYYIVIALMALPAAGTTSVVFARVVVGSFVRRRGTALGIMMSGTPLLFIIYGPLMQHIMATAGWRAGYVMVGLTALLIGFPCAALLLRKVEAARGGVTESTTAPPIGLSFKEAAGTLTYWRMVIGTCCVMLPVGGFLNQFPPLLSDKGFDAVTVAGLLSLFGIAIIVGRIAVGVMFDRLSPPIVTFGVMFLGALGALMLLMSAPTIWIAAFSVALIGTTMGSETDTIAYFVARQFGLKAFAAIFGTLATCMTISLGMGALMFGSIYSVAGNYAPALMIAGGMFLVSGIMFLTIGRPFDAAAHTASPLNGASDQENSFVSNV
jgi:predicted MFS family arabinose efflux permease